MTTARTTNDQRTQPVLVMLLVMLLCSVTLYGSHTQARNGVGGVFDPTPLLPPPVVPPQFDLTGFIQEATLDTTGSICNASDPRLAGGSVKVNGISVIVPCNTILQMPAATLTWQELFSLAPRDIGLPVDGNGVPTQTGLAQKDTVSIPLATAYSSGPLPSYEIHVQGNVVDGKYIAGLIFISQQELNLGQGTITAIDYNNGELQIATKGPTPGIARVRINDPIGRYGLSHGAPSSGAALIEPGYDIRFSIDEDSPTIHSATGYPMCIPRSDPFNDADDPLCPQANRPRSPDCLSLPSPFPSFTMPAVGQYCTSFMMPPPSRNPCTSGNGFTCLPDPTQQAPFEVGDTIDFLGTLKHDERGSYISAHTVANRIGIYTSPGAMPAYITIEALIQGTAPLPMPNLPQESTSLIKVEGFTTDPTSLVDIYAVDVDPQNGAISDRLLGTANPSGPPVIGRFRFVPSAGAFLPATREVRVVSRTLCADTFFNCRLDNAVPVSQLPANGLLAGQYHAPIFEFIFAENIILGDARVPANLQDLAFLYCGSGPLGTPTAGDSGPLVGQLDPAPWVTPMPTPSFASTLCPGEPVVGALAVTAPTVPPVITLFPSAELTVNSIASVFLSASATDASNLPIAINWSQSGGAPLPEVLIIPPGQPNAISFAAPWGPAQMVFTASATSPATGLTSSADVIVDVTGLAPDNVNVHSAVWANARQDRGILKVIATTDAPLDANGMPPPGLQLYVQAMVTIASLVPDGAGGLVFQSSAVQLAATPLPMFFADTGPLAVCPAGMQRCWQFETRGALVDPNGQGVFVPPDEVTVTSSLGGSATASQNNGGIALR